MKGVILAGGYGTRLMPLTRVTNKHLLPVYDKPMIYYPIECLVNAGIKDIMVVTGGNKAGDFLELLGNGKEFGLTELHYTYQEGAVADFFTQSKGAKIILKKVSDPQRFGVAQVDDGGRVLGIEEKPAKPKSNYAVIGIYMYDDQVFDIVKGLNPSGRGELEITDVNNAYIQLGTMTSEVLAGWWTDAGTTESLHRAGMLVAKDGANNLD